MEFAQLLSMPLWLNQVVLFSTATVGQPQMKLALLVSGLRIEASSEPGFSKKLV